LIGAADRDVARDPAERLSARDNVRGIAAPQGDRPRSAQTRKGMLRSRPTEREMLPLAIAAIATMLSKLMIGSAILSF
jgi:hypothetical protein